MKEDQITDAFFWPTMPLNYVMMKVDLKNCKIKFYLILSTLLN